MGVSREAATAAVEVINAVFGCGTADLRDWRCFGMSFAIALDIGLDYDDPDDAFGLYMLAVEEGYSSATEVAANERVRGLIPAGLRLVPDRHAIDIIRLAMGTDEPDEMRLADFDGA